MNTLLTNGQARELVAERDYLKARNVQLSESLDDTAARYIGILERLGFDREGNPIGQPDVAPALEWVDDAEPKVKD